MFVTDIRKDFDNLRGDATLSNIGGKMGITEQAISMLFQRTNVISPAVVRLFEAIGYDISLTFSPVGESNTVIRDTSRVRANKIIFQVRRGYVDLPVIVPNTKRTTVSSTGMMNALAAVDYDLSSLELIGEYRNQFDANCKYQEAKKQLSSKADRSHDIADVLVMTKICPDGTVSIVNKWVGKLVREPKRGPGRPSKDEPGPGRISIRSAVKMIDERKE